MTAEELVCELFIRQGYVILECTHPHEIGQIITQGGETFAGRASMPVRVVGLGTRTEFMTQSNLSREIMGTEVNEEPILFSRSYFYRVEAVD